MLEVGKFNRKRMVFASFIPESAARQAQNRGERMRQQILSGIAGKFAAMGIAAEQGSGADFAVHSEFLDANWSTGSKRINYEAFLFANDQERTVYMYEKTTEIGQGVSFGGGGSTSFQRGTTLLRKVKSIQYGPDGKAYEYSLDLGSIPKAVKETAKQYGWKFKTVLDKRKAMYPVGYVPPPMPGDAGQTAPQFGNPQYGNPQYGNPQGPMPSSGNPQYGNPQYANPQGPFYASAPNKKTGKAGLFGLIGFILLGLVLLAMLWAAEATPLGWGICLGLFAGAFLLQRLLRAKGCLPQLVLWVVTALLLLIALTFFAEGEVTGGRANPENAKTFSEKAQVPTASAQKSSAFEGNSAGTGTDEANPADAGTDMGEAISLPDHQVYFMTTDFQNDTTSIVQVHVASGEETVLLEEPQYLGMLREGNGRLYGLANNRVFVLEDGKIRYITGEDEYVARFDVHDDIIYYGKDNNDASDDVFERFAMKDANGQNEAILSDGGISQLVVDDYVYCGISSGTDIASLMRYDLDGSNKTMIRDKPSGHLVKFGAYLYFIDHGDAGSAYRMKHDGSDLEKMVQGPLAFTSSLANPINGIPNMGAINDVLYFINSQDGNRLYRTDGNRQEQITNEAVGSLYVKDSFIYCTYVNPERPGLYLLDENGVQLDLVMETTPVEYVIGE